MNPAIAWQIAIFIVSAMVSRSMAAKIQRPKPVELTDWDFPTVDEGTPQVVIFGEVWIDSCHILGMGNYSSSPIFDDSGAKK